MIEQGLPDDLAHSAPLLVWLARERAAHDDFGVVLVAPSDQPVHVAIAALPSPSWRVVRAPVPLTELPVAAVLELARAAGHVATDTPEAFEEAATILAAVGHPSTLSLAPPEWFIDPNTALAPATPPRLFQRLRTPHPRTATVIDWREPPVDRRRIMAPAEAREAFIPAPHHGSPIRWSHEAVLALVADLPAEQRAAALARLTTLPRAGQTLIASGCAGSSQCVRACPTGALNLASGNGDAGRSDSAQGKDPGADAFELTFDPSACIECGLCTTYCPEQALALEPGATWGDVLDRPLASGTLKRCEKCGMPHGKQGRYCAVCEFRMDNPTGVRLPPGFVRKPRSTQSPSH